MNLIYYYPMRNGAPSIVARNILDTLYIENTKLPFEEIIICTDHKYREIVQEKYRDIKILSTKDIFRIRKDDIIHIPVSPYIFPNLKFLLHIYARIKNNKIIINYHGDLRTELKLKYKFEKKLDFTSFPTFLLIPFLLANSNRVIVNSNILEDLIKNNYGVKSINIIPNGIESYWFSEDEETVIKSENVCEIFYHGRLSPEKGVDLLIEGFHEFLDKNNYPNNIILYIAGDGTQKKHLQSLAQKLKIAEKIIFLGNLDKKLIKAYLKRVDCAIYPSIWDNFPLSIIEALASANCPVFFSKRTGICDFLAYDIPNVFSPDRKIVAKIFQSVFEKKTDKNIIEKQKEIAKEYAWNNVINYYVKLYYEIAEN